MAWEETTHTRIRKDALRNAKVLAAIDGVPVYEVLADILSAEMERRGVKLPQSNEV